MKIITCCKNIVASSLVLSSFSVFSAAPEQLINLIVNEDGVYEVGHDELVEFGLDLSGEALSRISLFNNGVQVPIEVNGSLADSTLFGDGSRMRFIGQGIDSLYTDSNVYTLRLDSTPKKRIETEVIPLLSTIPFAQSYLETIEYAPQNAYSFASPSKTDPWYADRVLALRKPAEKSVSLELENMVPGGNTGSRVPFLRAKVWGATDLPGAGNDHHVRFKLNGQTVMADTFDGFSEKEMQVNVSNLRVGKNQVKLELPLDQGFDYEAVNLNSIELSYPRAFVAKTDELTFTSSFKKFKVRGFSSSDITVYRQNEMGQVTNIESALSLGQCGSAVLRCRTQFGGKGDESTYYVVAPIGIKKPALEYIAPVDDIRSGSAEYLIITHPDFIASAQEFDMLGALSEDLSTIASSVDVVDVEQIYAQFGNHILDPTAIKKYLRFARDYRGTKSVLLVGGDVYDYKGFENQDAKSFIPSMYVPTGDLINFAPVDTKYVDFDNDNVPDLALGRLPVRSMAELKILLDKRQSYLQRNYRDTALFVAGEFDLLRQYSFKLDALTVQDTYFKHWDVQNAFLDDESVSSARSKIKNAINQGVSLTTFFGHSSTNQWTFSGMFNGYDAANLANKGKPTIVTQWGCWNSYYVNPNEDSMGHRFLLAGDRGAVSVMGATTLTSAVNERLLSKLVYRYMTQGHSLGQSIVNAKQEFAKTRPDALDVLLGWTLLGFPELAL